MAPASQVAFQGTLRPEFHSAQNQRMEEAQGKERGLRLDQNQGVAGAGWLVMAGDG